MKLITDYEVEGCWASKNKKIKKYYRDNKAHLIKQMKEYRRINKERLTEVHNVYNKKNPWLRFHGRARQRCINPKNPAYRVYGGRGIKFLMTVDDFKKLWFRDKAYLLKRPSIDRKESTGNYEYGNCRFIELFENCSRATRKPIIQASKEGKLIRKFDSIILAENKLKICSSNIVACLKGKRKSAGGFIWRYKNDY